MIRFGTALKSREYPYHRLVVLSDPHANGGWVVLVRVTTDDGGWLDTACLLGPADWPELTHASTVAYSTAKTGQSLVALERDVRQGVFEMIDRRPPPWCKKWRALGRLIAERRLLREGGSSDALKQP